MAALLLILALFGQGIPISQDQSGVITGTLTADTGKPAAGVRVAVLAVPEKADDIRYATAMTSQGETDSEGHFRLENIPPGRYYITAGRVDSPTYFPGTQDITNGKIVTVKPGDRLEATDFTMNALAARPPDALGYVVISSLPVSFKISMDGGGPVPVFSPSGSFTAVRLAGVTVKREYRVSFAEFSNRVINIQQPTGSVPDEFRVSVEDLPEGYAVKSLRSGNTDLTSETLKVPADSKSKTTFTTIWNSVGNVSIVILSPGTQTIALSNAVTTAPSPQFEINIVLRSAPRSSSTGVRVSGQTSSTEPRSIYLSGKPGTLFADGTFEFFDVPPGRHVISTPDNPMSSRPQGASIVVGSTDLDGIQLLETPFLPSGVLKPSEPGPAGSHVPGVLSLARFKGRVLDKATQEPIQDAAVFLSGHYGKSYHTDADGKFEVSQLLPGTYSLEVQAFAHATVRQNIEVGDSDINKDFSTMPLN